MKLATLPDQCPLCGGTKKQGKTTFTTDFGEGLVVIRDVPASLCSMCGNEWIPDDVAARLENMVQEARQKHHYVEITRF